MARLSSCEAQSFLASLDRTTNDPAAWGEVCDALARLAGAEGSALIPADVDGRPAMPHSPSLEACFQRFVAEGWYKRDFRADKGFPIAASKGFVTDADIIDPDAMPRHPFYAELLLPSGLQWFLGLAFEVDGQLWGASIHRSPKQGPFYESDIEALAWVREHLALAAKRAALLGHGRAESVEATLAASQRGVAAIGPTGRILWMNEQAERMLGAAELLKHGALASADAVLGCRVDALVGSATAFDPPPDAKLPRPLHIATAEQRRLSLDAIPMPRDFHTMLCGVAALITIHEVAAQEPQLPPAAIRARYGLTRREMQLATVLATGKSLVPAAAALGISPATARQHLKALFSKTGTHSQVQLAALLAGLCQ